MRTAVAPPAPPASPPRWVRGAVAPPLRPPRNFTAHSWQPASRPTFVALVPPPGPCLRAGDVDRRPHRLARCSRVCEPSLVATASVLLRWPLRRPSLLLWCCPLGRPALLALGWPLWRPASVRLAAAAARLLRFGLAAATAPRDNPVKTAEVAWLHILRRSAACACRTTRHHDVERKQRADDPRFSAERACLQAGTLA